MPSTPQQRIKQASKAGKKSAQIRAQKNKSRDQRIYFVYLYLSGKQFDKPKDLKEAKGWVIEDFGSFDLKHINPKGRKPQVLIAAKYHLTPRQVGNILKKNPGFNQLISLEYQQLELF